MSRCADRVLILDFGSQTTQLIARRVRELGVYCEIHPYNLDLDAISSFEPRGLILSGGPSSVYDEGAPHPEPGVFDLDLPILGICYGMQAMLHHAGGRIEASDHREFGRAEIRLVDPGPLFARIPEGDTHSVWMSHGDRLTELPAGFHVTAESTNGIPAAIAHDAKKRFGVQFHPEVVHTPIGKDLLQAFVSDVCGSESTWTMSAFVDQAIAEISAQVGENRVVCGLSGGVDSTVASALVHRAIGDRLHCIFVDTGLLRKGEGDQVEATFRDIFQQNFIRVDAGDRFLSELAGVSDPEQKRKIIGRVFVELFEQEAKRWPDARFLCQGTLYPDVIESVSFKGPSHTIKSHHNVGGLPERLNLELVEPLRELFKDEVRAVGLELGIDEALIRRKPFPGPGLAVRILGEITAECVDILQEADAIMRHELSKEDCWSEIWQCFAVLLPVQTVGVMGDQRTYENVCALRAVSSTDGMTADFYPIDHEILGRIATRIINEVRGINRVCYDISSKPPATIEWE